jgi:hypothetical protein
MSGIANTFKKKLYNFAQKTKKRTNEVIGTEMEVEPEIDIESEDDDELKDEVKKVKIEPEVIEEKIRLSPYEREILPYYVGCYSDDPTRLSMKNYLGVVSNPVECIKRGKEKNYNFVGIQQGDRCYASNSIPTTLKVDNEYCNIGCNDRKTGTCGGYFYNKVYRTDLGKSVETGIEKNDTFMLVENYNSMNSEINDINKNLGNIKYDNPEFSTYPINIYVLAVVLLIITIILYLVIEKLN